MESCQNNSKKYSDNAITYNKDSYLYATGNIYTKTVADLSRICEEEDAEIDWMDAIYSGKVEKSKLFDAKKLKKYFDVKKILCSGADVLISKYLLIPRQVGTISSDILGIEVRILKPEERCIVEVTN